MPLFHGSVSGSLIHGDGDFGAGGGAPVISAPSASPTGSTTVSVGCTTDTTSGTLFVLARIGGSPALAAAIEAGGQSVAVGSTSPGFTYPGLTAATAYSFDFTQKVGASYSNVVTQTATTDNPGSGGGEIPAQVEADRSLTYAVRAAVAADRSLAYAVISTVSADRSLAWTVDGTPGVVARDLGLSYGVRAAVAVDRSLAYAVRAAVAADRSLAYAVRAAASADQALAYNVAPATGGGTINPAAFWGYILTNGESVGDNIIAIRTALENRPTVGDIANAVWNKVLP